MSTTLQKIETTALVSPVGTYLLSASSDGICGLTLQKDATSSVQGLATSTTSFLIQAMAKLQAYFQGERMDFDCPLDMQGTAFQKHVWQVLQTIPYGETRSYTELAAMAGHPQAVRAVASACARNPVPIFVPCHRVLRKNGDIGEYASGRAVKAWLLRLEKGAAQSALIHH